MSGWNGQIFTSCSMGAFKRTDKYEKLRKTVVKKERSLNSYIFAGLGKVWMWWPPRNEVKKRCKIEGRTGWFRCELCKAEREKIDVDHIKPVVPVSGFTTWDAYIAARFVTAEKLQGICKDCHKAKTKNENQIRREIKKGRNKW